MKKAKAVLWGKCKYVFCSSQPYSNCTRHTRMNWTREYPGSKCFRLAESTSQRHRSSTERWANENNSLKPIKNESGPWRYWCWWWWERWKWFLILRAIWHSVRIRYSVRMQTQVRQLFQLCCLKFLFFTMWNFVKTTQWRAFPPRDAENGKRNDVTHHVSRIL